MSETERRRVLYRAYRATRYHVNGSGHAFDLAIDQASPMLAGMFLEHGLSDGTYLTAHNPRSRRVEPAHNRAMQSLLLDRIRQSGLTAFEGIGLDPMGAWQAEDSVLILGAGFARACALAREFDQEALVFAGSDAIPRLTLLA